MIRTHKDIADGRSRYKKYQKERDRLTSKWTFDRYDNMEVDYFFSTKLKSYDRYNIAGNFRRSYEGRWREFVAEELKTTTPRLSLNTAVHGLMGYMFPRSNVWFKAELNTDDKKIIAEVRTMEELIWENLIKTHFYEAAQQIIMCAMKYGHCSYEIIDDDGPRIYVHDPADVYFEVDAQGNPIEYIIFSWLSDTQIKDKYGYDTKEEMQLVETRVRAKKIHSWLEYPFVAEVFCDDQLIYETGYRYQTLRTFIWEKEEQYITMGVSKTVLPLCRMSNSAYKNVQAASSLAARPPIRVPQSMAVKGGNKNVKLSPEQAYPMPHGDQITPIQATVDINPLILQAQRLDEEIRQAFHVPFFLSIADKEATATHVRQATAERAIMLQPMGSNVEDNLLRPILHAYAQIMTRRKEIPKLPKNTIREITFLGSLSRLGKQAMAMRDIDVSVMPMIEYAKINPQMMNYFNHHVILSAIANAGSIGALALKSAEEIQQIEQQNMLMQQAQQEAEMVKNINGQ